MKHARRTTTVLGGLVAAGAVVLSSPGLSTAAAATDHGDRGSRVDVNRDKSAEDGDGQANARVKANRDGHFVVRGDADGGGTGGLGDSATTADASASITTRTSAAEGTYRVVVRYAGARGVDSDRNDGDANLKLRTLVSFAGPDGADGPTLRRVNNLSAKAHQRTVTFTYRVPDEQSGRLIVEAGIRGTSSAPTDNDQARFNGSVRGTDITVKRIGG